MIGDDDVDEVGELEMLEPDENFSKTFDDVEADDGAFFLFENESIRFFLTFLLAEFIAR